LDVNVWPAEQVAIHSWITSAAGQAWLQRLLVELRLPEALDADLEEVLLVETERHLRAGNDIVSPEVWAKQRLRSRAIDVLRGRARRVEPGDPSRVLEGQPAAPLLTGITEQGVTAVRRRLHQRAAGWITAAALAVVATEVDEARPLRECPAPKGGLGERGAAAWVGLWYAGRHRSFPPLGEPDTAAVRKRRSRDRDAVHAELAAAFGEVTGG
jgi:hypothetical protein